MHRESITLSIGVCVQSTVYYGSTFPNLPAQKCALTFAHPSLSSHMLTGPTQKCTNAFRVVVKTWAYKCVIASYGLCEMPLVIYIQFSVGKCSLNKPLTGITLMSVLAEMPRFEWAGTSNHPLAWDPSVSGLKHGSVALQRSLQCGSPCYNHSMDNQKISVKLAHYRCTIFSRNIFSQKYFY